jgi:hypothetical protein
MRNLANDEGDALDAAQAAMPPPVDIPDVPSATLRLATTPLELTPTMTPDQVIQLRRQQSDATAAVRTQQQMTRASNTAHAGAIRVMNQLAERYVLAYESTPVTPNGRLTTDSEGPNPLFGNMFTAGLAAASAASAGRFGPLPQVPPFAVPGQTEPPALPGEAALGSVDPAGDLPADPGGEIGSGAGGGGLGDIGGGGFGGGGSAAPVPTAYSGLVAGPAAAGLTAGALMAAGAAGMNSNMSPMMPMMPMHPMHQGGDSASARRVPPWLVETENVWGESATIIPSVIGEEPTPDDDPIF